MEQFSWTIQELRVHYKEGGEGYKEKRDLTSKKTRVKLKSYIKKGEEIFYNRVFKFN